MQIPIAPPPPPSTPFDNDDECTNTGDIYLSFKFPPYKEIIYNVFRKLGPYAVSKEEMNSAVKEVYDALKNLGAGSTNNEETGKVERRFLITLDKGKSFEVVDDVTALSSKLSHATFVSRV